VPEPASGCLLIRMQVSGICGTDKHTYQGFTGQYGGDGRPRQVPFQGEVVGILNSELQPRDVIVNAAGSLPGDLHKLWRTRDPKGYHMEYGYSCMGYEIAGGLGVKMADPTREVYVLVGDGSYLMMAQEIVTAMQESINSTSWCSITTASPASAAQAALAEAEDLVPSTAIATTGNRLLLTSLPTLPV